MRRPAAKGGVLCWCGRAPRGPVVPAPLPALFVVRGWGLREREAWRATGWIVCGLFEGEDLVDEVEEARGRGCIAGPGPAEKEGRCCGLGWRCW